MSKRSSSLTETKSLISKDHLSKFDERRPAGYPSDKEIPVVLVLKRKAIRVYPDNQKVVLYYSQALDKYVSIPFGPKSDVLGSPLNESRKPKKEDDGRETYEALLKNFPELAEIYRKAKDRQPERQALKKIVRKRTPAEIMSLPPKERKVAYNMTKQMIGASDMPTSKKLGIKAGLATLNYMAKRKDKKTKKVKPVPSAPSASGADIPPPAISSPIIKTSTSTRPSVAESYRQKVKVLREERLDEIGPAAAIGAAIRAAAGSAIKRIGAGAVRAGKKARVGWRRTKRSLKNNKDKIIDVGSDALDVASSADSGVGRAEKYGKEMGGAKEHVFTIDPREKASDPYREKATVGGQEVANWRRMNKQESVSTSNIDKIKYIVENNINSYDMTFEGNDSTINLNNRVAKKVLQVYETLNTKNQKKFSKMLNENATTFKQAINFVIRH